MSTAERIAIIIPAWNEERRLPVAAYRSFLAAEGGDLCFVNDGSTDGTADLLDGLAGMFPHRVTVLHRQVNAGKAEAVRHGLRHAADAGYQIGVFLDADLAAPLASAGLLAAELASRPDVAMVLGARIKLLGWAIERSERRHYLGRIFATFASLALALPVYDTQCGAKALRLSALGALLDRPFLSRWLFDVELIARVRDAFGASAIHEVPLPEWRDPGGSKVRARDFLRAPLELWRIRRRHPPPAGGSAPVPSDPPGRS